LSAANIDLLFSTVTTSVGAAECRTVSQHSC